MICTVQRLGVGLLREVSALRAARLRRANDPVGRSRIEPAPLRSLHGVWSQGRNHPQSWVGR